MAEARHLHVVDPRSGELLESCPTCDEWARKYNGALSQLGQMRAELKGDEAHELFPVVKRLHDYWRERCNHPRTKFDSEDFKLILPYLRDYGEEMCRRAIEGAAYDPFTTTRKNGSTKRHDGIPLIFRSAEKFTEMANRAPYHLPRPSHVKALASAIGFLHPDWEPNRCVHEAQERLKRWRR